ncbi:MULTISPECIES: hypothetical protein [unclassified Bradyrhizobium]|uniref:hypothetical protein n=1 Tax=unclassified Bradyrhizobium TaxID=2631580 RepID=UPI0028E5E6FD|nr:MULTISPECIES: hypothetical protein [unclassified Bradyrhizobium]
MRLISMSGKDDSMLPGVHTLRFVASFALLGAVVSGIGVGWMDHLPFDPRIFGALGGAALAIAAKAVHRA